MFITNSSPRELGKRIDYFDQTFDPHRIITAVLDAETFYFREVMTEGQTRIEDYLENS